MACVKKNKNSKQIKRINFALIQTQHGRINIAGLHGTLTSITNINIITSINSFVALDANTRSAAYVSDSTAVPE